MDKKIAQPAGRDHLGEFTSTFAHLNDDVLFGEMRSEEAIDVQTEYIITVVSPMASGITDFSLPYHLQNVKSLRVTRKELAAMITRAAMHMGRAVFRPAKEAWGEKTTAKAEPKA